MIDSWIATYTKKQLYPFDPKPEQICIEDIAHSLSLQCRFQGHIPQHYSVCDHSCRVAFEVWKVTALDDDYGEEEQKQLVLQGLLHDSSESVICDVPRPIKPYLTGYQEAEEKI